MIKEDGKTYCDGCGKCMTMGDVKDSKTIIGIALTFCQGGSPAETRFIMKQLGEYDIGRIYEFCAECWLDSLMINKSKQCICG